MMKSRAEAFYQRRARLRAAVAAPAPAEQAAIALLLAMGYRHVAALGSALAAPFRPTQEDLMNEDLERARRLSYGGTEDD